MDNPRTASDYMKAISVFKEPRLDCMKNVTSAAFVSYDKYHIYTAANK